jgi:adenylate cyclase
MTFMDHRDFVENGHIALGVSASARALMLCFSTVRFSTSHVAYNVALAIASYIYVARLAGSGDVRALALVIATFVVIGLVIGWASRRTHTMFADVRRRDNLSRFLPRSVAERLIRQGEASLAPVQREVSVLFFDLRDFTTLSEKMSPREVLRFLDEYLGHMADVVKQHQGMVNKFLGDGMLALWGVPDHQPDHAARALAAALSMRARLAELNAQRAQLGLPAVRMGIGVHSGVVAAGMLGGADQHEYTVIGDAVNVASRVEGLTRRHEVDILATDRVLELAPNAVRARRIGEESVKGRSGTVVLHAILGPA